MGVEEPGGSGEHLLGGAPVRGFRGRRTHMTEQPEGVEER
jgi:hypothetical protein